MSPRICLYFNVGNFKFFRRSMIRVVMLKDDHNVINVTTATLAINTLFCESGDIYDDVYTNTSIFG